MKVLLSAAQHTVSIQRELGIVVVISTPSLKNYVKLFQGKITRSRISADKSVPGGDGENDEQDAWGETESAWGDPEYKI